MAQALDDFCASSCGKPFDAATIQWRDWCDANRDTFKPMDDMGAMGMNMGKSAAGHVRAIESCLCLAEAFQADGRLIIE